MLKGPPSRRSGPLHRWFVTGIARVENDQAAPSCAMARQPSSSSQRSHPGGSLDELQYYVLRGATSSVKPE